MAVCNGTHTSRTDAELQMPPSPYLPDEEIIHKKIQLRGKLFSYSYTNKTIHFIPHIAQLVGSFISIHTVDLSNP